MLNPGSNIKIYLCTGYTDMRKGAGSLSLVAGSIASEQTFTGTMFIFRGKTADKIKILWWDGQGFCLFYKCFDKGKFIWPKSCDRSTLAITKAQLSMLIEGIDWRVPRWTNPPQYVG